jgi:hypothetical protein
MAIAEFGAVLIQVLAHPYRILMNDMSPEPNEPGEVSREGQRLDRGSRRPREVRGKDRWVGARNRLRGGILAASRTRDRGRLNRQWVGRNEHQSSNRAR